MLFAFEKIPHISLSCKLVSVQCREYENSLSVEAPSSAMITETQVNSFLSVFAVSLANKFPLKYHV